jgi:hypothetical protein
MAITECQIILKNENGMPEDSYVNTLYFDDGTIPTPDSQVALEVFQAYDKVRTILNDVISGMTIKLYPPGLNPTGPRYQEDFPYEPLAGPGPQEVACCLSYSTYDDPERATPRRRGRIYVGPLGGSVCQTDRPNPSVTAAVLDLGTAIATVGFANNLTWVMRSRADNLYGKIESIWVDDSWDTQRRRGLKATARQVRDVQ